LALLAPQPPWVDRLRHDEGVSDFGVECEVWRAAREERLRDPHGWLAITAIHWLTTSPERFDDAPGAWRDAGGAAEVTLGAGEVLVTDRGELGEGTHRLGPLDPVGLRVSFGDAVAQVADRDGRVIVRPRHPDSPNLTAYVGTPCYPADPAWVVQGRYEPYSEPDGDGIGEVVFERAGAEHRLVAWDDEEGGLWILFRDATSGVTTYAALRQLLVAAPGPAGEVELDFNRAFNMPCAYTDFATCPLPPAANTLPFAVEAGEMVPTTRSAEIGVQPIPD
jgi:uncharacterized protein (DUF1684 family)